MSARDAYVRGVTTERKTSEDILGELRKPRENSPIVLLKKPPTMSGCVRYLNNIFLDWAFQPNWAYNLIAGQDEHDYTYWLTFSTMASSTSLAELAKRARNISLEPYA